METDDDLGFVSLVTMQSGSSPSSSVAWFSGWCSADVGWPGVFPVRDSGSEFSEVVGVDGTAPSTG